MRLMVIGAVLLFACSNDQFTGDDDSGGGDGSSDGSGVSDGASGDGGPAVRFCETSDQANDIFCMDFDDAPATALTTAFEKGTKTTIDPPQTSGASSAARGSDGVNGTGDADLSTPAIASGGNGENAYYYLPLGQKNAPFVTPTNGTATLRFSAYVDGGPFANADAGNQGAFITLAFIAITDTVNTSNSISGAISMTVAGHLVINVQGQNVTAALPTFDTWHDYLLTMSIASTTVMLGVKVDGALVGTAQGTIGSIPVTATADFMVGLQSEPPLAAATTRLDNVTFNAD